MHLSTTRTLTAIAIAAGALLPAVPAAEAAPSPVSDAVAAALAAAPNSNLVALSSASNQCTRPGGQGVAWTKNLIVLRTGLSDNAATAKVTQALKGLGIGGKVTKAERIGIADPAPGVKQIVGITLSGFPAARIADLARALIALGVEAAPDFALAPSPGHIFLWPNGFPTPAPGPEPSRTLASGPIAIGASIFLYDTGLAPRTVAKQPGNVAPLEAKDVEEVDKNPAKGIADFYYSGHTIAISSVIKTVSPGAKVWAGRITNAAGIATDFSATKEMARTLIAAKNRRQWPHAIVTPFGSPGCDVNRARPGTEIVPLGMKAVAEMVRRYGRSLIVASAGNRSTSRRFYPAAFSGVVAVGALDTTADRDGSAWYSKSRSGPVADFSNYGTWVDAWAPGVELATNHLNGMRFEASAPVIRGAAFVGGTSFSAPYVAAQIVEIVRRDSISPLQAWAKIAVGAKKCAAGVGSGVAIALVAKDAKADKAASEPIAC